MHFDDLTRAERPPSRRRATGTSERELLAAVLDQGRFLVCAFDRDGRFDHFNSACEQVSGYSFADLDGRTFYELLIVPGERDRVRRAIDEAWDSGTTSENENHWVARDGTRPLIAWVNTPVPGADGATRFILSIGINLSERSAVEAELRRVQAELERRVDELHVSRRRLVEASMASRRQIERDLHDGAQQRLVALALLLDLARSQTDTDARAAGQTLDRARAELVDALGELRDLARGIHPAVLIEQGLPAALHSLAERAPMPVEVGAVPYTPLGDSVETAIYFLASEALQNVARHARGATVSIEVRADGENVVVEIADDGPGGATFDGGSGLSGLADRVEALGGSLRVDSPQGRGTTIAATIPGNATAREDPATR